MLYKKLLVPFDRSEHSQHALKLAVKMVADDPAAEIVVFRSIAGVRDVGIVYGRGMEGTGYVDENTKDRILNLRAKQLDAAKKQTEEGAAPHLEGVKNPVTYLVEFDPTPVEGVLDAIKKTGADGVVIGCRGMNAVSGMLGSVSYGVARSADVPVTVVK